MNLSDTTRAASNLPELRESDSAHCPSGRGRFRAENHRLTKACTRRRGVRVGRSEAPWFDRAVKDRQPTAIAVVVTGALGAGKTTLGRQLAREIGATLLSKELLEEHWIAQEKVKFGQFR